MKKLSIILGILLFCSTSVFASEVEVIPNQEIQNTKGFVGLNYERQDSEQVGKQKISNDHSFLNFNLIIIKQGALFNNKTNNNAE